MDRAEDMNISAEMLLLGNMIESLLHILCYYSLDCCCYIWCTHIHRPGLEPCLPHSTTTQCQTLLIWSHWPRDTHGSHCHTHLMLWSAPVSVTRMTITPLSPMSMLHAHKCPASLSTHDWARCNVLPCTVVAVWACWVGAHYHWHWHCSAGIRTSFRTQHRYRYILSHHIGSKPTREGGFSNNH